MRCLLVTSVEELTELLQRPPAPPRTLENFKCPVCAAPLQLKPSRYGLFYGCTMWRTTGCPGSERANLDGSPLVIPVDAETREARLAASASIDQLWKTGRMTRKQACEALAQRLEIPIAEGHVGVLTAAQCGALVVAAEEMLTEEEHLRMTECGLMGESVGHFSDEERQLAESLPRDRDALSRKLQGGYLQADRLCRLFRISMGATSAVTVRNIFEAIRTYDRQLGRPVNWKGGRRG